MARQFSRSYTHDHVVNADGSVDFACSTDHEAWPWLTLGPHHPVVVQAQNFWCSVGAILKLGEMEEGQWSALTWTDWRCGMPGAGDALRGIYEREKSAEDRRYLITLFDAEDREVVRMRGRGVVFRNRNFEKWRGDAKREANYDPATIPVLVTPKNGLPPANPMLGGSGDHVNSVHMIEAARQALCLARGRSDLEFTGGEMTMTRYVELGTPFELELSDSGEQANFTLRQLDRNCARFTLRPRQ